MTQFQKYRFEDLDVWRLAMEIVHESYVLIKKFPSEEKFGLADQLRRAANSIALNIAEGSGQPTGKGFVLYVRRARSSLLECVACVKIAIQEGFIGKSDVDELEAKFQEESFKLIALEKSIKNKHLEQIEHIKQ